MERTHLPLTDEPLWYKDAVIYELHVKSFHDSDGDGIGDFPGVTEKLDYLQSLGVTALWLLPFYPSPLRDDGYDIADYYEVNPQYGTLNDFKHFLREAHRRGMRVIAELVMNHTSDQHEWFQKSRNAKPGSAWRDFYVWSDTTDLYKDARIIFKDFETSNWTWDPVARQYYWHRFYSHQPDLNFDNPAVVKAMFKVLDYWFSMGVDGMRLDAVPYLFEREGTNCENLPETYEFLRQLRAHLETKFKDKMLLAEANQWPEDAVAYFGAGDRCHMAFHFPLMPRIFMGSWMEDRFPIIDIFEQTPAIPENCQWALFLRNHDELTLEMVSDEERDYMYRVYANDPTARINLGIRRRLAPLLGNNRRKIELLNILLFSLPGTPVIYYGDEIGMGDNHYLGDRNGVRTPMQWNADRNAGFSRSNPQKLFLPIIIDPEYHYESVNVENQERNQSSLLWWMRRVIAMRKRFKAFGRGRIEFLSSDNNKVLVFMREYEEERILVVVNLSRFSQSVEIDLGPYIGFVPEETASGNRFPPIKEKGYTLTLGPYGYYWLTMTRPVVEAALPAKMEVAALTVEPDFGVMLSGRMLQRMESEILPRYLSSCSWFPGRRRIPLQAKVFDVIPVSDTSIITILDVTYREGTGESYLLPLSLASGERVGALKDQPQAIVARIAGGDGEVLLFDSMHDDAFRKRLLTLIARRHPLRGARGRLMPEAGSYFRGKKLTDLPFGVPSVLWTGYSNALVNYNNQLLLKLFRRVDEGSNPDVEIGQFFAEQAHFPNAPLYTGTLEYRRPGASPVAIAMLQKFVPNESDGLTYVTGQLAGYFEKAQAKAHEMAEVPKMPSKLLDLAGTEVPPVAVELMGGIFLELAATLGRRTAEMHLALQSDGHDPRFTPESFSLLFQRSLYHAMRSQTRRSLELLRRQMKVIPDQYHADVEKVLGCEKHMIDKLTVLFQKKIATMKIRIHGDYRLEQILYTGIDVVIVDFEGDTARTVSERRLKRSPLRDVAGMVHSIYRAAYGSLLDRKTVTDEERKALLPWMELWYRSTCARFLRAYFDRAGDAAFIPRDKNDLSILLQAFMLEKATQFLAADVVNRPDRVIITLREIEGLM